MLLYDAVEDCVGESDVDEVAVMLGLHEAVLDWVRVTERVMVPVRVAVRVGVRVLLEVGVAVCVGVAAEDGDWEGVADTDADADDDEEEEALRERDGTCEADPDMVPVTELE